MGLLARVQELTAGREKTTIGEQDVADGIEFLESLKSRVKREEVQEAISTVNGYLKKRRDKQWRQFSRSSRNLTRRKCDRRSK
jgi:hypothetical protein